MGFDEIRRLRQSAQTHKAVSETDEDNEFMPYSSVCKLIENHPVCKAINISNSDIHKCLAYIFSKYKSTCNKVEVKCSEKKQKVMSSRIHTCFVCKKNGCIIVDSRSGDYICRECGVVQRGRKCGETITYSNTEDEPVHEHTDQNIPKWAFAQNAFGDIWWGICISQEVEHWNQFIHIKTDDLQFIKKIVRMMDNRASDLARIASAFCMFYMIQNYSVIDLDFKNDIVEFKKVEPLWTCHSCNEHIFYLFAKSRHKCYAASKRLEKRKQWSLVRNKETRMKVI